MGSSPTQTCRHTEAFFRLANHPFLPLTSFTIHTIIFWLFGIAAIAVLYRIVRIWNSPENTMLMKCFSVMLVVALLLVAVFLYNENMYDIGIS